MEPSLCCESWPAAGHHSPGCRAKPESCRNYAATTRPRYLGFRNQCARRAPRTGAGTGSASKCHRCLCAQGEPGRRRRRRARRLPDAQFCRPSTGVSGAGCQQRGVQPGQSDHCRPIDVDDFTTSCRNARSVAASVTCSGPCAAECWVAVSRGDCCLAAACPGATHLGRRRDSVDRSIRSRRKAAQGANTPSSHSGTVGCCSRELESRYELCSLSRGT